MRSRRHVWLSYVCLATSAASAQTPLTAHYPPGQSGVRGASTPAPGVQYTNFSRFFTNLELVDPTAPPIAKQLRFANISMITWTTSWELLGLRYGALAGIPFATGDVREPTAESGVGLGDILLTPVSLYGKRNSLDYQFQFTVWSPSGHFSPGSTRNRGTGFWALVYSIGAVYYPSDDRQAWSISAVARIEQNFEQHETGIHPGDDIAVDWGAARMVRLGSHPLDIGVSGFGSWQLTDQQGGPPGTDEQRYRLLGIGPEVSLGVLDALTARVRAHWEFGARNIVRGNNLWLILNYRF
jgi:hypothetical protein